MLVKINDGLFVLASDVVSVKKITKIASDSYGKWVAVVKHEHGTTEYFIQDDELGALVSDINRALKVGV